MVTIEEDTGVRLTAVVVVEDDEVRSTSKEVTTVVDVVAAIFDNQTIPMPRCGSLVCNERELLTH